MGGNPWCAVPQFHPRSGANELPLQRRPPRDDGHTEDPIVARLLERERRAIVYQGVRRAIGRWSSGRKGCSNSVNGPCSETHYHRLDQLEVDFLRFLGELMLAEQRVGDDPATPILAEIDSKVAERDRMQDAHMKLAVQFAGQPETSPIGTHARAAER